MVMKDFIKAFPDHIEDAIKIAESIRLKTTLLDINNIVISGQGGSAIGGVIVKNLLHNTLNVPIIINKNYTIPSFVNENTLFIASSYSGNTEETLSALKQAETRRSHIFLITSGGKMLDVAQTKSYDHIVIPKGGAPRAMLCYSVVQLLFLIYMLQGNSIQDLTQDLLSIKKHLVCYQNDIIKEAISIVDKISNKMPFIYACDDFEGVALRFKQQLNENSKRHACYNLIPEMNHNEIVPWVKKNMCVIPIFINGISLDKNKKRVDININQILKSVDEVIEVKITNNNYLIQYFHFIHLLDWVSLFLAEKGKVDPDDITLIDVLKKQLKNT